jgi:CheY-like chemotaxis protein
VPSRPILLVEDDHDSRMMLAMALEFFGYDVITATNGMEAYNLAREHQPSLILLDLLMRVLSGEDFRRALLANADIRRIPVIVVSAHHESGLIAKRMRAAGCLAKPVNFDALATTVKKWCG